MVVIFPRKELTSMDMVLVVMNPSAAGFFGNRGEGNLCGAFKELEIIMLKARLVTKMKATYDILESFEVFVFAIKANFP